MFDTGFAMLFRAVDRLRRQLETADEELRPYLAEELRSLQQLSDQYMDDWVRLDENIHELCAVYELDLKSNSPILSTQVHSTSIPQGPSKSAQLAITPPLHPENFSAWLEGAFAVEDVLHASLRKGIGYFDLLMFDEAVEFLTESTQHGNHPIARLFLAAAYQAQKKPLLARAQLAYLRGKTQDLFLLSTANELEAHLFASEGRFEEAIGLLQKIAEIMPDYPDVWFNLGLCFAAMGNYGEAMTCLMKTLQINSDDKEAGRLLVLMLLKVGDIRKADEMLTLVLRRHPKHADFLLLKSELSWVKQHYEEGVEACRQVLQLHPNHESARAQLAKGLIYTGKLPEAIGVLKKQISLHPRHPTALVQLGVAYLLTGQFVRAETCILQSMTAYADKSYLWLVLGRLSALQKDTTQAYNRYIRALRDPRKAVKRLALYLHGLTLFEEQQYEEAEKYLKAARTLGRPNPAITVLLANIAEIQGRTGEAQRLLESIEVP